MFRQFVVLAGTILSSAFLTASPSEALPPPATCIGKHCAVVAGGPAAPAPPHVVVATGIVSFLHPAVGIYCLYSAGELTLPPFAPLVSVAHDLTLIPVPAFGVSFAEVNFGARLCPRPPVGALPLAVVEIDTFGPPIPTVLAPPVAVAPVPSDAVGFSTQF